MLGNLTEICIKCKKRNQCDIKHKPQIAAENYGLEILFLIRKCEEFEEISSVKNERKIHD